MNIVQKIALILVMATSLGAASVTAYAEESVKTASVGVGETISHIEKALVEISNSDFNAAQVHLKAARTSSETITGNNDIVKKANALVIQGQIKTKLGDIKSASDELNKALELYKSM